MIVSIDIGTSYSSICIMGKDGKVVPVDVSTGISMYGSKYSLPTAVFLEDNSNLLVGQAAMNSRRKKPQNFRMEFKRDLGQNIPIYLGNESFLPEDLYTRIFIHFKQCAEKVGGEPIDKAYITYPASYGKNKKDKIIYAAKSAGLFNTVLVDEPTAAAMSFVADGALKNGQNLMVYDFGGGTFDVSLIHYENDTFTLLAEPDGIEHCGGMDIDRIIYNDIISNVDSDFMKQLKANQMNHMKFECQLSELSVKAKHHLSSSETFVDDIPTGMFESIEYTLSRDRFNGMVAQLIGQTISTCHSILKSTKLKISDLSAVLMVGGTSRIPIVCDMVKQFAGNVPVIPAKDLELAVVSGAIEYSESSNNEPWKNNVLMPDDGKKHDENSSVFGSSIKRSEIETVTFVDTLRNMPNSAWDVSADSDRSVMAWTVRNRNMYNLFIGAEGGVNGRIACKKLFEFYTNLKKISFNGCFHTEETTDMSWMFNECSSLEELDVSRINTSNVTNMGVMFQCCNSVTSLDISHFDTSKVTDMRNIFFGCKNLKSLDVSNFKTTNVTNMRAMFGECNSLTFLNVSPFDTSNVTDMGFMFSGCNSLTSLDVSNFKTANVMNMRAMFQECNSLTSLDVSNFDTSKVTDMSWMFNYCKNLKSLDVSNFNTSNVTNMSTMFHECNSVTSLDVGHFDTSKVTNMNSMFEYCNSVTSLDVSHFDTSKVTDMGYMFRTCENLKSLDVSNFKTANVTSMAFMFFGCSNLKSLDVSHFDTSKVTGMIGMFFYCINLESLDVSHFDTSNVTNMRGMFGYCNSLTFLSVSHFDTSKVTDMENMFYDCYSLQHLDVSRFDTSKVTNMGFSLFY